MTDVSGAWTIEIATPMGAQKVALDLTSDGSSVAGTATNAGGTWDVTDGRTHDSTLTFAIHPTAPFPLDVLFELVVDGDSVSGSSQAGSFPQAQVHGQRT